jgi:hypothetical protein
MVPKSLLTLFYAGRQGHKLLQTKHRRGKIHHQPIHVEGMSMLRAEAMGVHKAASQTIT